jgi:hypothetical protein
VPIVLKSGNVNFLEPSGPVQACNGIALPFTAPYFQFSMHVQQLILITKQQYYIFLISIQNKFPYVIHVLLHVIPRKDEAQTALFKDAIRTAL